MGQTARIDIVLPVFNRAPGEAQRATNVSSFQSLAGIPQIHLMAFDPVNHISSPNQTEHGPANKKTNDHPGPSTYERL
jgi:hypothetical protein